MTCNRWTLVKSTFAFVGALCLAPALGAGTTYWVDDGGNDNNDGLSDQTAWKHIYVAVARVIPGDTIKILPGTYNVAGNSEVFPIPVPAGVIVIGSQTSQSSWPLIAGDVNTSNSSTVAVFELVADGISATGARLQRLIIQGEDNTGRDAPSAVRIEAKAGGSAGVVIQSCKIGRLEMNDGNSTNNRPTILGVGGEGTLSIEIRACEVVPTVVAGVKLTAGDDCVSEQTASDQSLTVTSTEFRLTGTQASAAAIDALFVLDVDSYVTGIADITDNLIDSREVSSEEAGFASGILYGAILDSEGATVLLSHDSTFARNEICGCRTQAILFNAVGGPSIQSFYVQRNLIHDNPGDAIVVDAAGTVSYQRLHAYCNLIYANRNGVVVLGTENQSGGEVKLQNNTIADNEEYGVVAETGAVLSVVLNEINYFNDLGSWYSPNGWTPSEVTLWSSSDWEGETGAFDPEFADHDTGDYHLESTSDCRNAGDIPNGYSAPGPDIYGGRRVAEMVVDMGADEFDPND